MLIIDTHCHASTQWYEPVEALLFQMDRNDVEMAILTQIFGEHDNRYQFECVARYPDRFLSIVGVNVHDANAVTGLEALADEGAAGVRISNRARSLGEEPFAIWRKAETLELPVSCSGSVEGFVSVEFQKLIKAVPRLPIIIEHLGGLNYRNCSEPTPQSAHQVMALAQYPNVYLKISGLGMSCERAMPVKRPFPFKEPIPPLLEMAYAAFGADRMMWGSDYPPVSSREGYRNSLLFPREQFAGKTESEQEAIFGGTASKLFKL